MSMASSAQGRHAWRSLLFVPADRPALIEKAHLRGADAIILDLEDAVPAEGKAAAQETLGDAARLLVGRGCDVVVRINSESDRARADLSALLGAPVAAVMLPKVESPADVAACRAGLLAASDGDEDCPGIVALVESPAAMADLFAIARAPGLTGLAFGSEDFSTALGVPPTPACLQLPCQMVTLAAAATGVAAYCLPISIGQFRDLEAFARAVATARALGATGALCIHPAQVALINEGFAPTEAEHAWACSVLEAWGMARARGAGTAALEGKMIDKPVVARAEEILARGSRQARSVR
ncbi:MAG: CoA ester lyase [Devosia sp.]|nr:CoA ester lyase [Devosia sp.]